MNTNMVTAQNSETMSSSQLAVMLGYDKKEVHKKIRAMFGADKAREKFSPDIDAQRRIDEYNLPELESKMFVAKFDINYLEEVTQFWIDNKNKVAQPQLPTTYLEALKKLIEVEEEKVLISEQRDEAIKTKALIIDKKTATAMNTASRLSKENKLLQSKLQYVGEYLSVIAAGLPQRVVIELNDNAQTWRVLMKICKEMKLPPKKVKDERYGEVNTYHLSVIHKFKADYLD